jgi:uncharacterized repeat protein (TIGR01451 family)
VAAGSSWDLRIFFDLDPQQTATRWFGALALGSDAGEPGDLGMFPVELTRRGDDVTKVADVEQAEVGDIIEYTLFVDTNLSGATRTYDITDRLPPGMELVAGSVQADRGSFSASVGQIEWTFDLDPPEIDYEMTTSAQDVTCDTGFDGYANLEDFGIPPSNLRSPDPPAPGSPIDSSVFTTFVGGDPINLYGIGYAGISFTDDGFVLADAANNYGGAPGVAQTLPDPALPNNLAALLWQDMEIVNDPANFKGVSLANADDGARIVIEYDDVQPAGGDGSVTWDFQVFIRREPSDQPGVFEIVYAYDNLSPFSGPATIGVENATGSFATTLVNNAIPGAQVSNGTVVCFDQVTLGRAQLTYRAEVVAESPAADGNFTNTAHHVTTEVGSRPETAVERVMFFDPDSIFRNSFEASE